MDRITVSPYHVILLVTVVSGLVLLLVTEPIVALVGAVAVGLAITTIYDHFYAEQPTENESAES